MAAVLDQLNLVSRDIDATIGFYRLLGLKLPKKAVWRTANGAHHVSFPLANGMSLDFDSPALARAYNKGYRRSARGGNVVIGFGVQTRRSVDNTYAKLTNAGHRGTAPLGCLLGFALRHRRRSERQPYRDHESGGSQEAIETAFGLNGRDALYQMPGSNRYFTLVK